EALPAEGLPAGLGPTGAARRDVHNEDRIDARSVVHAQAVGRVDGRISELRERRRIALQPLPAEAILAVCRLVAHQQPPLRCTRCLAIHPRRTTQPGARGRAIDTAVALLATRRLHDVVATVDERPVCRPGGAGPGPVTRVVEGTHVAVVARG